MLRQGAPLNLNRAVARVLAARNAEAGSVFTHPYAGPWPGALAGTPAEPRTGDAADGGDGGAADAGRGGSRRRRLWELPLRAHCPVLGVCLSLDTLRRIAHKVLAAEPAAEGYELHVGMVAECRRRGAMALAMQRELDRRYLPAVRSAAGARSAEALADWWQAQAASHDLPGALWATLSHARCTPPLEEQVLGQVHMLQHQVGRATRVELARFEALMDENLALTRALATAQQRCTQQAAEHARRSDALQAELLRQRGRQLAADTTLALLREELQQLRDAAPQRERQQRLAEHQAAQAERLQQLQRELQAARGEIERLSQAARLVPPLAAAAEPAAAPVDAAAPAAPPAPRVQRNVLCVGGRTASVPVYRRLVEASGGHFLHHDGGEEDKLGLLDATLAAADLVICQAGCVSHNAYWRVKDHCKRTGKRCVFAETPSAASLQRALAAISSD